MTDETRAKRTIVELKMDCCSYNEIAAYFRRIEGLNVSRNYISSVLVEAGERAKFLNGIYDSKVREHFRVIEVDEVFQGNSACYLGVVDKESRYLLELAMLDDRSASSFKKILEPISRHLVGVEVVITDGYNGYVRLIGDVFDGAIHVFCHVHAHRVFLKEIEPLHRGAREAHANLKGLVNRLGTWKKRLDNTRRRQRRAEQRLSSLVAGRDAYHAANNIEKYSKKAHWTAERTWFKEKINNQRACVRSRKKTIDVIKKRIVRLESEIKDAKTTYWAKKQLSMQSAKLVNRFKEVLKSPAAGFKSKMERFLEVLDSSRFPVVKRILKFLKNNPHVMEGHVEWVEGFCPPWLLNTNTIEGIFGVCRAILDKARRFYDSEPSMAVLEIQRLKHNITPPFTGPNRHESPLQRAGCRSRFKNYLDAIFPLPGDSSREIELHGKSLVSQETHDIAPVSVNIHDKEPFFQNGCNISPHQKGYETWKEK